jgi:hypothetical protein
MNTPADGWADEERDLPEDLARELSNMGGATALPIEVLRAAGTGVLPDDLEQAAQAYLARTPQARALVEELNDATALDPHSEARLYARISQGTGGARAPRPSSTWLWRAAAAIGAIAIAGSTWLVLSRDRGGAPAAAITQPAPEAVAANKPAAPAPETFLLPLERPDVRISLRALTWRGSERANPILTALKPALDAFRAGDYQRADAEFSAVDKQYPKLIEVALYRGVSRLFLGDLPGATSSLQDAAALRDAAFANDIEWYLAIADERSGRPAAARARLEALCPAGAGDPRACAALARK